MSARILDAHTRGWRTAMTVGGLLTLVFSAAAGLGVAAAFVFL